MVGMWEVVDVQYLTIKRSPFETPLCKEIVVGHDLLVVLV